MFNKKNASRICMTLCAALLVSGLTGCGDKGVTGQSPLLRSATPRGNREIQYNPPLSYKDNLLLIPKD